MPETLIPLTANFTVPTSCSSIRVGTYLAEQLLTSTLDGSVTSTTQTYTATGLSAYGVVTGSAYPVDFSFDPSCYPSGASTMFPYYGFLYAYSPGACPVSWTTFTTRSTDGGWIATCCPAEMVIPEEYYTFCVSSITSSTLINDDQTPANKIPISTGTIAAVPVYIRRDDPPSPGLSTGAKAGIGVGVAAAFLLFAALCFWLYRRKRRQNQAAPDTALGIPELAQGDRDAGIKELSSEQGGPGAIKELDGGRTMGTEITELAAKDQSHTETNELEAAPDTRHDPAEMTAEPPRAEFDGTGVSMAHPNAWELDGTAMVHEYLPITTNEQANPVTNTQLDTERETVALAHEDIQDQRGHFDATGPWGLEATGFTGQPGQDIPATDASSSGATLAPSGIENGAGSVGETGQRREELLAELNRVRYEQDRLQLEQLQRREQELREELNRMP